MSSTHSDGPLVARERQLQELWRQVAGSAETGLRVAVVRGPAGIGKTRLLQAFAERARASGAAVIAGRSPHLGGHPHAALSDVLGAYVRTGGAAAAQVRRAGDALVGLVPALAAFDPRPPGAPDVVSVVQATFRLVRQVTERRPLVVIVDDAHLADADSCEVLATLQRHAADLPWTLALGWRDPADTRPAARELLELLRRDREVVDIELAPLDGDDAAAFIAALLGDGLPARSLVEMLQARAAGNPYYLEEMVRWARARDAVRRTGLQWMPVAGLEQELPPSLEAALRERTRGLAPAARQLLEWLVVAGAPVGFPLLAGVTGMPAAALADALDDLRRAGLVAEHGGRRAEYTVHHPLLREWCSARWARRVVGSPTAPWPGRSATAARRWGASPPTSSRAPSPATPRPPPRRWRRARRRRHRCTTPTRCAGTKRCCSSSSRATRGCGCAPSTASASSPPTPAAPTSASPRSTSCSPAPPRATGCAAPPSGGGWRPCGW